jgi:hypothetical protein
VFDPRDDRASLGSESSDHKCRTSTNIWCNYRGTAQALNASHNRMMSVGANIGAKFR